MRKILSNKQGNIAMVGTAVAILVTLFISVMVVYSIMGALDENEIDENFGQYGQGRYREGQSLENINGTRYAHNASEAVQNQAATFYTLAPLIVVVLVAVVILGYVTTIGRVE